MFLLTNRWKFEAITGLWCPSMLWAARALQWWTQRVITRISRVIPFSKEMGNLLNVHQAGDRPLELLVLNEEFLVSASHQLALITSLPFVHTARRSYRLDDPVKMMDRKDTLFFLENIWTLLSRGRRSRNKVSVGEPADGSLTKNAHFSFIFFNLFNFK